MLASEEPRATREVADQRINAGRAPVPMRIVIERDDGNPSLQAAAKLVHGARGDLWIPLNRQQAIAQRRDAAIPLSEIRKQRDEPRVRLVRRTHRLGLARGHADANAMRERLIAATDDVQHPAPLLDDDNGERQRELRRNVRRLLRRAPRDRASQEGNLEIHQPMGEEDPEKARTGAWWRCRWIHTQDGNSGSKLGIKARDQNPETTTGPLRRPCKPADRCCGERLTRIHDALAKSRPLLRAKRSARQ